MKSISSWTSFPIKYLFFVLNHVRVNAGGTLLNICTVLWLLCLCINLVIFGCSREIIRRRVVDMYSSGRCLASEEDTSCSNLCSAQRVVFLHTAVFQRGAGQKCTPIQHFILIDLKYLPAQLTEFIFVLLSLPLQRISRSRSPVL